MLAKSQLRDLYYWLHLNRAVDDRLATLYRTGKAVGGVYTGRGQEAISVGTAYALQDGDVVAPMIRNCGALLVRGIPARELLAQCMGRSSTPTRGRDGNPHVGDLRRGIIAPISMLGALVPVAAGAALAMKMRRDNKVALTYIGDGGTSTADFHEGLNLAAVRRLPLVVVIEHNGWAYSTPTRLQTACTEFITRARGYGVPGFDVDGNDVLAVYDAACEAFRMAREGRGPVLICAVTMRMKGHAEHDDAWYVPRDELELWRARDPLARFERYLADGNFLSDKERAMILDRVRAEVEEAAQLAEKSPLPEGSSGRGGVYCEPV